MAEDGPKEPGEYPGAAFPVIFSDGVSSLANSKQVVKFYLSRTDPSTNGVGEYRPQAFAQVVMPIEGFIATAAFFNAMVAQLMKAGHTTKEEFDEFVRIASGQQ